MATKNTRTAAQQTALGSALVDAGMAGTSINAHDVDAHMVPIIEDADGSAEGTSTRDCIVLNGGDQRMFIRQAFAALSDAFLNEVDITRMDPALCQEVTERKNRLAFPQRTILGCIIWKLSDMADKASAQVSEQLRKIQRARQSAHVEEGVLLRLVDWHDVLVEQRAYIVNAMQEAKVAYEAAVGEPYGAVRSTKPAAHQSDLDKRLASLGL